MAEQEPEQQTPKEPQRLSLNLGQLDFDPSRIKLPQIAAIGFVIGILFHACVAIAVLDGGSGGGSSSAGQTEGDGVVIEQQSTGTPAATTTVSATPRPPASPTTTPFPGDRSSCDAIRGTEYRSDTERQWFIRNCST